MRFLTFLLVLCLGSQASAEVERRVWVCFSRPTGGIETKVVTARFRLGSEIQGRLDGQAVEPRRAYVTFTLPFGEVVNVRTGHESDAETPGVLDDLSLKGIFRGYELGDKGRYWFINSAATPPNLIGGLWMDAQPRSEKVDHDYHRQDCGLPVKSTLVMIDLPILEVLRPCPVCRPDIRRPSDLAPDHL